jgi:hypothetical protein
MIFRRQILGMLAGGLLSRLLAESYPGPAPCGGAARSEVDRLIDANPSLSHISVQQATYSASATVTLFSIPIVSRSCVGSGYTVIEEAVCPGGARHFHSVRSGVVARSGARPEPFRTHPRGDA